MLFVTRLGERSSTLNQISFRLNFAEKNSKSEADGEVQSLFSSKSRESLAISEQMLISYSNRRKMETTR
jgi:hypothetical protein